MAYVFLVKASLKILLFLAKLLIWQELSLSFLQAIIKAQEKIKLHIFVVHVNEHSFKRNQHVYPRHEEDTIIWVSSVTSRFQKLFSP